MFHTTSRSAFRSNFLSHPKSKEAGKLDAGLHHTLDCTKSSAATQYFATSFAVYRELGAQVYERHNLDTHSMFLALPRSQDTTLFALPSIQLSQSCQLHDQLHVVIACCNSPDGSTTYWQPKRYYSRSKTGMTCSPWVT